MLSNAEYKQQVKQAGHWVVGLSTKERPDAHRQMRGQIKSNFNGSGLLDNGYDKGALNEALEAAAQPLKPYLLKMTLWLLRAAMNPKSYPEDKPFVEIFTELNNPSFNTFITEQFKDYFDPEKAYKPSASVTIQVNLSTLYSCLADICLFHDLDPTDSLLLEKKWLRLEEMKKFAVSNNADKTILQWLEDAADWLLCFGFNAKDPLLQVKKGLRMQRIKELAEDEKVEQKIVLSLDKIAADLLYPQRKKLQEEKIKNFTDQTGIGRLFFNEKIWHVMQISDEDVQNSLDKPSPIILRNPPSTFSQQTGGMSLKVMGGPTLAASIGFVVPFALGGLIGGLAETYGFTLVDMPGWKDAPAFFDALLHLFDVVNDSAITVVAIAVGIAVIAGAATFIMINGKTTYDPCDNNHHSSSDSLPITDNKEENSTTNSIGEFYSADGEEATSSVHDDDVKAAFLSANHASTSVSH